MLFSIIYFFTSCYISVKGSHVVSVNHGYDTNSSRYNKVLSVCGYNFFTTLATRTWGMHINAPSDPLSGFDPFRFFHLLVVYDVFRFLMHFGSHVMDFEHHKRHHIVKCSLPFVHTLHTIKDVVVIEVLSMFIGLQFVSISYWEYMVVTILIQMHDILRHGGKRLPYEGVLMGVRDHALHHYHGYGNFGFIFPWWDEICGTRMNGRVKNLKYYNNKHESSKH
jgi:sterol desaturase/sphingolipid hydroxylase (fatty acid hydroxylase superfamily)